MARVVAWVVYPDRVERVEIVKRGANARSMRRPIKEPLTGADAHGDTYIVPLAQLFNDPVSASLQQAEYAQRFGTRANPVEDEDDDPDSDNELDEEEEEDEDEEDEDDED